MREKLIKDEVILKNLNSGKRSEINRSLEYLYKINYPVILRFIKNNNGTEPEAADIFQDSLITFFEKIRENKLELTCSIGTYLYSISRNLWLKRLKKLKMSSVKLEDIQEFLPLSEDIISPDNDKFIATIEDIFSELSGTCKEILVAFYYDNMSMKEIMKLTGYKSEQTVKNKKYKCMKELSNLIFSSKKRTGILKDCLNK